MAGFFIFTLMKKVIPFLTELSGNNNRDWFNDNKKKYEAAKEEFEELVVQCIALMGKWDKEVLSLAPKDCIYRIYRDVRFGKDKTPYKTSMSALIGKGGRKGEGAINYLHIEPGKSFVASGMYMPDGATLKAIRQEIDYNLQEFEDIINNKSFKANFGELEQEWKLKKLPKGYTADNPAIEYLKLKGIVATKNYSDKEILKPDFAVEANQSFKILKPLNDFLNRAKEGDAQE